MEKNNFDFLRFAFAFVVVLSHIIDLSLSSNLRFLKPFLDTHISVTGFFVISGFLISGSYLNTPQLGKYFEKRARRLLPAYVFVVALSAFALVAMSSMAAVDYFFSGVFWKYLLSNLVFLNFIQPCLPGVFDENTLCAVNGALWTIKVEVSFYLLLPVMLYWVRRSKHKIGVYIFLYLLGLTYQLGLKGMMIFAPEKLGLLDTLAHQLPGFLTYFAAGMFLYHIKDVILLKQPILVPLALIVFACEYYFTLEILRPMAMGILILFLAYNFKFLNHFGKYGDFSYGIYIFHFPLIQTLVALQVFEHYNHYLLGLGIATTVLFIAIISWNFIEKPFLKRKVHS